MRTARRVVFGALSMAGVALLIGCGPGPDAGRIEYLQNEIFRLRGENDRLTAENTDLRARYAQAIAQRDAAQAQIAALQNELANLRTQPQPTETGDWTEREGWAWLEIGSDFLFDSGRATLRQEARARIQQIARDLQTRYSDRMVVLVGHTDTDPIRRTRDLWEDNLDLSCGRSMTVFRELQRMGISPTRMMAAGQGEFNPRASNAAPAGKQQNRRVTFLAAPMPPTTGAGGPTGVLPPETGGVEGAPGDNVIIK